MVLRYGFPDCLLTDKGREWALVVFVCYLVERLQNRRRPAPRRPARRRPCHKYVKSKRNVRQ
jgi:hypothetical protein